MYISIHTPTKGATKLVGDSEEVVIFQSTLPRRERLLQKEGQGDIWVISIHTPTKGATSYTLDWRCWNFNFNPHSHEGSDWISSSFSLQKLNFNPHSHEGSDIKGLFHFVRFIISIHTPTKGATAILTNNFLIFCSISLINFILYLQIIQILFIFRYKFIFYFIF